MKRTTKRLNAACARLQETAERSNEGANPMGFVSKAFNLAGGWQDCL